MLSLLDSGWRVITYNVEQEVPADGIILHQMGCDVRGGVGGKGHQEVGSCYRQGATCWKQKEETRDTADALIWLWYAVQHWRYLVHTQFLLTQSHTTN